MAQTIAAQTGASTGERLALRISQTAHGFSVGEVVYHNGSAFALAQADNAGTLGIWLIFDVIDANTFQVCQVGRVTVTGHGLTVGDYYYVSATTAGALTDVEPAPFSNPLVFVQDTNTLHVLPFRPSETTLPTLKSYMQAVLAVNQTAGFAVGSPIRFATVQNSGGLDVSLDSGTFTFTLSPGRTYSLTASLLSVIGGGSPSYDYRWFDVTAGVFVGSTAEIQAMSSPSSGTNNPVASALVSPSVTSQYQLRFTAISGTITNIQAAYSFARIESIDATVPPQPISYVRRSSGLVRGVTNTNVVRYSVSEEINGGDISYVDDINNGGSFLINTSGIYSVSVTSNSIGGDLAIKTGLVIDNVSGGSTLRVIEGSGSAQRLVSWEGYVPAGNRIWVFSATLPTGAPENNQITVVRVR